MDYRRGSRGVSGGDSAETGGASARTSLPAGPPPPPRLLDQVRDRLRVRHFSRRTEQAYVGWIRRFILANGKRHPRELGGPEVERFLTRLAVDGNVAPGTQNQALWRRCCFSTGRFWACNCPGWSPSCGPSVRGGCRWCCRGRKSRNCWRCSMDMPG